MTARRLSFTLIVGLVGIAPQLARGADIRDFTLITLGDYSAQVEVEGSAFIGGNIVGGNPTFGTNTDMMGDDVYIPAGGAVLELVGNVASGVNQVHLQGLGTGYVNQNVSDNQRGKFITNGSTTLEVGTTLAADKVALTSQLTSTSAMLSLLTADSTATIQSNMPGQPGPLVFNVTPGSDGVAVFDIDGSLLSSQMVQQIQFNGNASSIIVNVSGTNVTSSSNFVGGLLSNSTFQAHTLFNFYQATTLNINAGIAGAVLAPLAHVNVNSTTEGAVFANSMTQNGGEIHGPNYDGYLPPPAVPEPGTFVLLGLGLPGIAGAVWMRRRLA